MNTQKHTDYTHLNTHIHTHTHAHTHLCSLIVFPTPLQNLPCSAVLGGGRRPTGMDENSQKPVAMAPKQGCACSTQSLELSAPSLRYKKGWEVSLSLSLSLSLPLTHTNTPSLSPSLPHTLLPSFLVMMNTESYDKGDSHFIATHDDTQYESISTCSPNRHR